MGLFGKPPSSGTPGKTATGGAAPHSTDQGSQRKVETPKQQSGKNAAKANSGEGGKAFGSPTTMGSAGTGFEPNMAGAEIDRWSSAGSSQSGQQNEWGDTGHEAWEGGGVWQRNGWNGTHERGNEW